MEHQQCLGSNNGNSLASSPMPVIGVYIAASTLVCLLFLLIDVYQGFRSNKHLLPSKIFSLNSLTLTLLGISTKLPVDLTSSMPGGVDQLSKLCGPVLLTIAMGFFTPSLADMEGFELLGNMISLTILVVTIIVNVCIQMSTGVIFSFYLVEHVLALSLMLLTLVAMWYVAYAKSWVTNIFAEVWQNEIEKFGDEDHITTVNIKEFCGGASFLTPQFGLSNFTTYAVYTDFLCIISLGTLFESCVRTYFLKHLKFCSGESDYKWSLWIVVASQILTALIGTFAITYRSFFKSCLRLNIPLEKIDPSAQDLDSLLIILAPGRNFVRFEAFKEVARYVSNHGLPQEDSKMGLVKLVQMLEELVAYIFYGVYIIMGWADYAAQICLPYIGKGISCITRNTLDLGSLEDFLISKGQDDIDKFVEKCEKEEPLSLIKLLQDTRPSQFSSLTEESHVHLLLVLLVRVASTMVPDLGQSLVDSLSEIFDIVYFIDDKSTTSAFLRNLSKRDAKELWMTRGLSNHWFQKQILSPLQKGCNSSNFNFNSLLAEHMLDTGTKQLSEIVRKRVDTNEVIRDRLQQLFLDIMYFLLPQFPRIMLEYITQCPVSELEKRSRTALKLVCKYEMLVPHVEWLTSGRRATQDVNQSAQVGYATSSLTEMDTTATPHDEILEVTTE